MYWEGREGKKKGDFRGVECVLGEYEPTGKKLDWMRLKVKLNLGCDATSMKLDVLSYKFAANFSPNKFIFVCVFLFLT